MLDREWPFLLVQNHTRAFGNGAGARALERAEVGAAPDVVVPFEPAVPAIADRGWPNDRLPRSLTRSLARLTDLILGTDSERIAAAILDPAPATRTGRHRRRRVSARPSRSSRSSRMLSALRRLLPLGSAGPRPA